MMAVELYSFRGEVMIMNVERPYVGYDVVEVSQFNEDDLLSVSIGSVHESVEQAEYDAIRRTTAADRASEELGREPFLHEYVVSEVILYDPMSLPRMDEDLFKSMVEAADALAESIMTENRGEDDE